MANQITDNRTAVADAANITDGIAGTWVGSTSPAQDTDVYIEGAASIAEQMTNSLRYVMWNAGSAQNFSNNVFYIWINCGVVGLLTSKASGGFRIRFAGATITDYFEVYVGGSDSWPNAVAGGWVQFVVDIEGARSTAVTNGWTGGTTPATSAIQYVGYAAITSAMTKVADNTWIDAIWRLPDGNPGIIVEGRNAGTTPWDFADIYTQLGQSAGCFRPGPSGTWVINTPLQIGINDTTTHEFSDSNALILWDNQEYAPTDLYKISALGNAGGTTNVTLGVKTGSGTAATGAQGATIQAASTGVRWAMDFNDPNLDSVGLYGCTFQHGGIFDLDDPAVDIASVAFLDCSKAHVSNAVVVRPLVVNANTTTGNAFMDTDDIGDIAYGSFSFSAGHAIEILSGGPATQSNIGNIFLGSYGGTPGDNLVSSSGSNDAMIYNNSGAAKTFNRSGGGTQPSFRNGASATSDDVASISLTFTPLIAGSDVSVFSAGSNTPISSTDSSGTSYVASVDAGASIDYKIYRKGYLPIEVFNVSFSATQNVLVAQQADRNYDEVG